MKKKKTRFPFVSLLTSALLIMLLSTSVWASDKSVLLGGMPFGVKFYSAGVVIVGFTDVESAAGCLTPALDAGLEINDKITKINGKEVSTSEELSSAIENSTGSVNITYERNGQKKTTTMTPTVSSADGKRKGGMWIRDTTAGIGTVTFIEPTTGMFTGLGHGILDAETGNLYAIDRGQVIDVTVSGVEKGVAGTPGELKGIFKGNKIGEVLGNTQNGVYGVISRISETWGEMTQIELGSPSDVATGDATVWCTVEGEEPQAYSVTLSNIATDENETRSFFVTVTDPRLLEKTGGIVHGMSGSPIVQNNKLVGAVTHVLISDPTTGYGIFIDKMVNLIPSVLQ